MFFSKGWFCIRLHCSFSVCLRFFTAGWYVVTKGKILSLAFFFCVKADGLSAKLFPWNGPFFPNPPRIPIFYTLTKIHKPKLVGRPIISGCDSPTERISSFVDTLLQPIAQKQKSFIKDTTDFISFIEKTKIGKDTIYYRLTYLACTQIYLKKRERK